MTDVAQQALDLAREAKAEINAHEDVCAERYTSINRTLDEIKSILKWAGSTLFGLLIAVLAWSVSQQWSANNSERDAIAAKVDLIQRQQQQTPPPQQPQATPSSR